MLKFLSKKKYAERGGIIPYYKDGDDIYYLLGAKKVKSGYRWSDFGGGCKKKENVLECTMREFTEESRGIVHLDINDATHIHIINSKKPYRVMFFVPLNSLDVNLPIKFDNKIPSSKAEEEIVKMKWFSQQKLLAKKRKTLSKSIKEVIDNGLISNHQ